MPAIHSRFSLMAWLVIASAVSHGENTASDSVTAVVPKTQGNAAEYHAPSRPKTAAEQRWQPMSPEKLQALGMPSYCQGAYQTPEIDLVSEAFLEADNARFAFGDNVSLNGNVLLRNGKNIVTADSAEYYVEGKSLTLDGNIRIATPDILLVGNYAEIGADAESANVTDSSYVINGEHIRGSAQQITRSGERSLSIVDGFYTHCAPDDKTWSIAAKRIDMDIDKGIGVARGAKVKILNTPILYVPYLQFPIGDTRKSGLLWPAISTARNASGLDITVPLYWNIKPEWDMTIAPRTIGTRATGIEFETRFMNRFSYSELATSYINDNESEDARWLATYKEQGQFGDHWFHDIDYTEVSDDLFFEDFDTTTLDVRFQTHLKQTGRLSFWNQYHTGFVDVTQYQTIEPNVDTPFKVMPQLHWRTLHQDRHAKLELTGLVDIAHFENVDSTESSGQRSRFQAGVYYPLDWQAGFIRTHVQAKSVRFTPDELDTNSSDEQTNHNGVVSIDAGLRLERFNEGRRITLEPRLYYLYANEPKEQNNPIFDTTIATDTVSRRFTDTKFIGYDRLDDANDISLGLTSRWYNKEAKEILSASIAQTYFLSDKTTDLDQVITRETTASDFVGSVYWRGLDYIDIESHVVADKNMANFKNGHARAVYNNDEGLLLGITQVYNRNATVLQKRHQTELSAAVPINSQWTAYGQLHYDHINKRDVQHTVGVAREDCCWRMRLVMQDTIRTSEVFDNADTSFHLQFELKGLGGTGDAVVRVLQDAIYGFNDE